MENNKKQIARAKTVLVSQQSQDLAVVCEIIAKISHIDDSGRINFTGPVTFTDKTKNHICNNILPLIKTVTESLGLLPPHYEISATNPGIASTRDTYIDVSGLSADLSVFAAMLSSAMQIPVPDNILFTGHIASAAGDIGSVGSIETKMQAASKNEFIDCFIYPKNNTVEQLFARDILKIIPVSNILEVVKVIFKEEDIVTASLNCGFFKTDTKPVEAADTLTQTVEYFLCDNDKRFWQLLRQYLITGKTGKAKKLLKIFAQYHIKQKIYPRCFGDSLFSLICAAPPAVRRNKDFVPLLDTALCIQLAGLAGQSDYEDVYKLFDAVRAKIHTNSFFSGPEIKSFDGLQETGRINIFDKVISQINDLAITNNFGAKIDSARASFLLNSVIVEDYQQFMETIKSFYIHLRCYEASKLPESTGQPQSENEAIELLEDTFRSNGGMESALQMALDGTGGGMRKILDEITDFYKQGRRQKYMTAVFKQSVDSLCWDERVEFMRCAMKRLRNFLPKELLNESPERFARNYEAIALGYVKSMDTFNQLMNRF